MSKNCRYILLLVLLSSAIFLVSLLLVKSCLIEEDKKVVFSQLSNYLKIYRPIVAYHFREGDFEGLRKALKALGKQTGIRFTVILPDGTVAADSHFDESKMENHANRPEIREAFSGKQGKIVRFSTTAHWRVLKIAEPLYIDGKLAAVARCEMVPRQLVELERRINFILLFSLSCACLLFLIVFGLKIAEEKKIYGELIDSFDRLIKGDFSFKVYFKNDKKAEALGIKLNELTEFFESRLREKEERKELLERVFSAMREAVLVVDSEGKITELNSAARQLLSVKEDWENRYVWELLPSPEMIENLPKLDHNLTFEMPFLSRHLIVSIAPISELKKFVIVLNDITETKKLTERKSEFIANASHELRTPLTVIRGYLEIIEKEGDERIKEYASRAINQIGRLIDLVNDLLLLSGLERSREIEVEEVDLREVVEEVLVQYEEKIKEKGLQLERNFPTTSSVVRGNRNLLEHLVLNLVDNAYKYTDRGKIEVGVEKGERTVTFYVKDTGRGIPKQLIERIFERFYVLSAGRNKARSGTGLGLAIVKHIALKHNAKIEVETELEKGTTFKIIFPL